MRLAYLSEKLIGKTLARPVYGQGRQILLRSGVTLTEQYLNTLLRKGYTRVYVQNELIPDLQVDEVVSEQTQAEAYEVVKTATQRVVAEVRVNMKEVTAVVDQLIAEIDSDVLFGLTAIRSVSDRVFAHSVNVAILSLMLGNKLHLSYQELRDLGVGAMLHDIGKLRIPADILEKPEPLTPGEWETMKQHTSHGYEIMTRLLDTTYPAAAIAYQHHERMDGSGYPRGLPGREILSIARVAAIANAFDSMTSDRIYDNAKPPEEAARILREQADHYYDREMAREFLTLVAHYPTGSIVRLESREVGVVVQQQPGHPDRPIVRLVADGHYQLLSPFSDVEVNPAKGIRVERILPEFPQRILEQASKGEIDLPAGA